MINFFHYINWPFARFNLKTKKGSAVEGHVDPRIHKLMHFSHYSWYMYIHKKMKNSPQTA